MVVLGTIRSFLEPFCGHLSPKIDKVCEELTLRYPHEGPCVGRQYRRNFGAGISAHVGPEITLYRGTSLIRNSPPPQDHHWALGIFLL